jgi:hypothetical protein
MCRDQYGISGLCLSMLFSTNPKTISRLQARGSVFFDFVSAINAPSPSVTLHPGKYAQKSPSLSGCMSLISGNQNSHFKSAQKQMFVGNRVIGLVRGVRAYQVLGSVVLLVKFKQV